MRHALTGLALAVMAATVAALVTSIGSAALDLIPQCGEAAPAPSPQPAPEAP